MKRVLLGLISLVGVVIIAGCGGAALLDAPEITTTIMDTTSVTVVWTPDTSVENNTDFSGYNVYVATDSSVLLVTDGENLNAHNSVVITDSSYTADNLAQDSIYYIQVRTVNTDDKVGDYNVTVPFVTASPRPEFTATVTFEMNTPGVDIDCAIRLADATLMADSAMVNGDADLWVDCFPVSTKDTIAFDSPSHSLEYGSGANLTYLVNMGQLDLDSLSEVTTEPTDTTFVPIIAGDLIVVKTADGHYAKIHVDTVDTTNNYVTVTYAYQDNVDFPYFAP